MFLNCERDYFFHRFWLLRPDLNEFERENFFFWFLLFFLFEQIFYVLKIQFATYFFLRSRWYRKYFRDTPSIPPTPSTDSSLWIFWRVRRRLHYFSNSNILKLKNRWNFLDFKVFEAWENFSVWASEHNRLWTFLHAFYARCKRLTSKKVRIWSSNFQSWNRALHIKSFHKKVPREKRQ